MSKEKEISLTVDEVLQLVAQHGGQLTASQLEQALQSVQGSQQEKSSMTETKQEEINTGEAHRAATFTDRELWGFNKKMLAAKEMEYDLSLKALQIKDKEIEVARKEHDFAIQQQLDHLKVVGHTNAAVINNFIHSEYAKFNAAASEPISPDTGSDKKDAKK